MTPDPTEPDTSGWGRRFDALESLVKRNASRFDSLEDLVRKNAQSARKNSVDAATNAAIKVTAENTRAQVEIRQELLANQEQDRRTAADIHHKVNNLNGQMNEVLVTLNKLSTAKLTQVGITGLILAALVVIGIKALGG